MKKQFQPPYCPNPNCIHHSPLNDKKTQFIRYGSQKTKKPPHVSFRFQCKTCKKVFTQSFFAFSYRDRQKDNYQEIISLKLGGFSKLQIASRLSISLDTVCRRMAKVSRQGLLRMELDSKMITESIAYDGIENFSFSQYDPNNINHAVGRDSLYIYDFNFCHLNRKGRMSDQQRERKGKLEGTFGKYPKRAIEACSKKIFTRLQRKAGSLLLHTDNHFQYKAALDGMKKVSHYITPGNVARNYRNRLFAINHCDLLTRHHLSDFKRETIAFAKTSIAMMDSFIIFSVYKNYLRPCFTKKQKKNERSNLESPAMRLGLATKILKFKELFKVRLLKTQVKLRDDWLSFFKRQDPFSRRPIRPFLGT